MKNVFEKSFRKEEEFHQSSKLFERKIRNIEGFDPFTNDWKNIIENTVLDKARLFIDIMDEQQRYY